MNFLNMSDHGRAIVLPFRTLLFLLFTVFTLQLNAQCSIETTITPSGQISFAVVNPEPGSTYSWVATGIGSGTGPTAVITYPNTTFNLQFYVNGSLCFQKPVAAIAFCESAFFTPVFNNQNCSMDYKFNPPSNPPVNRYWNFGDGSPIIQDNTTPATHAYPYPGGTFTVTCWAIQTFPTQINVDRCSRTVDVACTPPDPVVTESEVCCVLNLTVDGGFPDCAHEWQILNSNGTLCTDYPTYNTPVFTFQPSNINTYNTNTIKIRHRVLCGGTLLFQQDYDYTIETEGIYIGDPNVVNDDVSITLTSCLNNGARIFPDNQTYTGNIRIYGTLDITDDALFQDADVCVLECEGIDGMNGRLLSLKGCNIHEPVGCRMWRGIDIPAGGKLDLNTSASSASAISGAKHAVRLTGNPQTFNVYRTSFTNNYVGVFLNGVTMLSAPSNNYNSCTFTTAGQLPERCGDLDPVLQSLSNNTFSTSRGFAGIVLNNCPQINILPSATATFSNLANGIWYENSSTNNTSGIKDCVFNNIQHVPAYGESSGNAVLLRHSNNALGRISAILNSNSITNCQYGFRALSSVANTVMNVKNVTMTNVDNGVDYTNTAGLSFGASVCEANTIQSNVIGIKAGGGGITVTDNDVTAAAGSTGILVKNGSGDVISMNRVNNGETGIMVQASTDCVIAENTMTGSSVGMRFIGDCTTPHSITCNTFDNDAIGLLVDDGAATGEQKNTGNVWVSPGYQEGSLIGAQNDNADVSGSLFFTDQNSTEYPYTIVVVSPNSPGDWFNVGSFVGCADGFSGGSEGRNQRRESTPAPAWEIAAYPNPTTGSFMLSIGALAELETANLSMYDLSGKVVQRMELTQAETTIHLGDLPAGLYLVAVQRSSDASVQYLKIQVQ